MKIVFYSSNSNNFDSVNYTITTLPSWKQQFEQLKKDFPMDDFIAVTQAPGMFLCDPEDLQNNQPNFTVEKNTFIHKTFNSHELFVLNTDSSDFFSDFIFNLSPDMVISASFWVVPFDWLPVNDSIIGDKLLSKQVKVFYHPLKTTLTCFNKYETHNFLEKLNLPVAEAVFVNHDLYFCAGNKNEVHFNVYKSAILKQISKMHFPLIIKDNVGLSSYGMQIVNTIGEVSNFLNSKKNNSDRIIEEYISGQQFGCEIHGTPGNYRILPLFAFSVNQYGITSPKQSIKYGPVTDKRFKISELNQKLLVMAEAMQFKGIAQVDLVFDGEKWTIIEINPRLSGMSTTYSSSSKHNFYKMLFDSVNANNNNPINFYPTVNLKIKLASKEKLNELKKIDVIRFICQTENKDAKQEREKGYCEIIITADSKEKLLNQLQLLEKDFTDIVEEEFILSAKKMILDL